MNRQRLRVEGGFTLVEILVVIAILGVLAAIAITQFSAYQKRSLVSQVQSDLKNAATAEEALQSSGQDRPDLIVTDLNLKGTRGLDLIEQLHTAPETRSIPVITLSALDPGEIHAEAQARGAVANLEKPVRLQTLLEIIREHAPKT